jgi:hypothetical protein
MDYSHKLFFLRNPHRKKSFRVTYGDHGGQRSRPTMRPPKASYNNSCVVFYYVVFIQHCEASQLSTLSNAGHVSCRKHFLCLMMLSAGVLSYLILPCHAMHC